MADEKLTPNASTYKQVVQNMDDIANLKKNVKDVQEEIGGTGEPGSGGGTSIKEQIKDINSDITNIDKEIVKINKVVDKMAEGMDVSATGDVYGKFPDLKVIGIHANTDKTDENTPPSGYKRDITYEIKSVEAIGLTGKEGMTSKYCLMVTTTIASQIGETDINFKPFRMAYGNSLKRFYSEATDDDTWGNWTEEEKPRGNVNIITSETEPEQNAQTTGDFWFQELP